MCLTPTAARPSRGFGRSTPPRTPTLAKSNPWPTWTTRTRPPSPRCGRACWPGHRASRRTRPDQQPASRPGQERHQTWRPRPPRRSPSARRPARRCPRPPPAAAIRRLRPPGPIQEEHAPGHHHRLHPPPSPLSSTTPATTPAHRPRTRRAGLIFGFGTSPIWSVIHQDHENRLRPAAVRGATVWPCVRAHKAGAARRGWR
jgi:hypothetical protein